MPALDDDNDGQRRMNQTATKTGPNGFQGGFQATTTLRGDIAMYPPPLFPDTPYLLHRPRLKPESPTADAAQLIRTRRSPIIDDRYDDVIFLGVGERSVSPSG